MSIHSDIPEWWDDAGHHHDGYPDDSELLNDARQLTVHIWDDDGNEQYFTTYSHDGWTQDELDADIDDAADHYGIGG